MLSVYSRNEVQGPRFKRAVEELVARVIFIRNSHAIARAFLYVYVCVCVDHRGL